MKVARLNIPVISPVLGHASLCPAVIGTLASTKLARSNATPPALSEKVANTEPVYRQVRPKDVTENLELVTSVRTAVILGSTPSNDLYLIRNSLSGVPASALADAKPPRLSVQAPTSP